VKAASTNGADALPLGFREMEGKNVMNKKNVSIQMIEPKG